MGNTETKQYCYKHPHPAVAADCVVFGFDVAPDERGSKKKNKRMALQVLLIERGEDPFKGYWALPGGFLLVKDYDGKKTDESIEACALRELREETGITNAAVEQFRVYSAIGRDPRPDERVISVAHLALVKKCEVVGGDDAKKAQWFDVNDLPELAFDHRQILDDALEELRCRIHYKPIGFELMPEQFTMSQLKQLYDTILGNDAEHELDRRNFHRKMVTLGIVEPADADAERRERSRIMFRFNLERYFQFKESKSGFRPEF
ncbi:MAG: NUDIX domain-containing protein [Bacteroidales bacterium]|nr:NUDIX domain-containing protein [Bacteroidales bacterium]